MAFIPSEVLWSSDDGRESDTRRSVGEEDWRWEGGGGGDLRFPDRCILC